MVLMAEISENLSIAQEGRALRKFMNIPKESIASTNLRLPTVHAYASIMKSNCESDRTPRKTAKAPLPSGEPNPPSVPLGL